MVAVVLAVVLALIVYTISDVHICRGMVSVDEVVAEEVPVVEPMFTLLVSHFSTELN